MLEHLQQIGALLTGLGAFLAAATTFYFRVGIASWFMTRAELIARRDVAIRQASVANEHAAAALQLVDDYKRSLELVRDDMADMRLRMAQVERLKAKYDAIVDYLHLVIDYIVFIEKKATLANLDMEGRTMPPIPDILADRFGIPEALR